MNSKDAIVALAALAQESRLVVFRLLVQVGPAGIAASKIDEQIGVPTSSLSFHLKELTHAGLVSQERQGRNLIYRAAFDQMSALLGYLTDNCCEGEPCLPSSTAGCAC